MKNKPYWKRKLKIFTGIFIAMISSTISIAQTTFQLAIGDGTNTEGAGKVIATYDGNYITAGYNNKLGEFDIHLLKISMAGSILWSKTYGTSLNQESCYAMAQGADSGYIMSGLHHSGATGYRVLSVRTDKDGNLLWSKTYGKTPGISDDSYANGVAAVNDGGYIFCGLSNDADSAMNYDVYVIKTNAAGDKMWSCVYGSTDFEGGNSIMQTNDGGFIISAGTSPNELNEILILKIDGTGNLSWSKHYAAPAMHSYVRNMFQTNDGGYVFCGGVQDTASGIEDMILIKMDGEGVIQWQKQYTSSYGQFNTAEMKMLADSGFVVCGRDSLYPFIFKTDASGNPEWSKSFKADSTYSSLSSVDVSSGGVLVFAGSLSNFSSQSHTYLIAINDNDFFCNQIPSVIIVQNASLYDAGGLFLRHLIADEVISYGLTDSADTEVVTTMCTDIGVETIFPEDEVRLYPNPNNGQFRLEGKFEKDTRIAIYNLLGEIIMNRKISESEFNTQHVNITLINSRSEMLLLLIESENINSLKKFFVFNAP